jgi:hypothetical protein
MVHPVSYIQGNGGITIPLVMEEMQLQKEVSLEMQGSDPTTRLLIGRLVTSHGENYITFKPQSVIQWYMLHGMSEGPHTKKN